MERLFSYGTLQLDQVQQETFGRLLSGEKDTLIGYALSEVRISDEAVVATSGKALHPILKYTGNPEDQVEGTVFEITVEELAQADDYEVAEYVRVATIFHSGNTAWAYVCAETEKARASIS
ncbi:gamma-glutamylcyclotransferase family protein [Oceanospirillum linum]|uniref:UDP-N-acetylmuramate--alanine ligase n=1 Tax=Oceanospirillum linum TaxID=966 RepID=A0A1T1HDU8_OCELI|nr:gamma-glutamylcyclotransferase family protein [Oceanospirillum linum]OOV88038.1 UDP-N-acetylmuramate--alanine ligase [Oceanospirillum linum]SEF41039.1 Gamma-glutamyl cyclotransferase, AIG2-like [Oleiphilus messinensis]SMP00555.1 Gamma-glutamyl cyclotransferase, AIG2-like [Oceanospirillum linum]